jgi:hypothetical protein
MADNGVEMGVCKIEDLPGDDWESISVAELAPVKNFLAPHNIREQLPEYANAKFLAKSSDSSESKSETKGDKGSAREKAKTMGGEMWRRQFRSLNIACPGDKWNFRIRYDYRIVLNEEKWVEAASEEDLLKLSKGEDSKNSKLVMSRFALQLLDMAGTVGLLKIHSGKIHLSAESQDYLMFKNFSLINKIISVRKINSTR